MQPSFKNASRTRRQVLTAGAGLMTVMLVRPAQAEPADQDAAIRAFVGEAVVQPGKVKLDVPPLVENGNSVGVSVTVDSPMTATSFVKRIGIFNEKNPQPNVAIFHLTARAGHASVSTRMRLATTQRLTAIAELSDGTFWSDRAEVIVTLAACTEEM
jgi:sulfur-oxidizing protein SoxY